MKKKILFLIHALNPAGGQRVLVEMVNNMDPERFDITVQTIFDKGGLKSELRNDIHYKTIFVQKKNILDKIRAWLLRRVFPPKFIYDMYIKGDYDYEVGYLEGECTRIISASTNPNSKKYAWVHTNLMKNFGSQGLYKSLDDHKAVYKKFDKIICVSKGAKDGFVERFGFDDNVIVKYNILHDEKIICKSQDESSKPEMAHNSQGVHFVTVGNFRPEKSYDRLLKACRRLKDDGLQFDLFMVGDGVERENIERIRDELSLSENVYLLGLQMNPYPFLKQSDCLVCSSLEEGYSTVVVEACILGVPTITTDCCSMDEILDNGKYGMIVPNSEEGLYQGMRKVIEDPDVLKQYRELLPERREYFSIEQKVKEIEELFI